MAAAILMMNMHGAVMAADKDQTIFRYSEKVPFSLVTDPCSKLPMEDLWNEFRATTQSAFDVSFKQRVELVVKFMSGHIGSLSEDDLRNELSSSFLCVGYESDDMFPYAAVLKTRQDKETLAFLVDKWVTISRDCHVFHQAIGKCTNINILLGGISDKILNALYQEVCSQLANSFGVPIEHVMSDNKVIDTFLKNMEEFQKDPETKKALSYFTIKDMVTMEENLIDTENLNHSSSTTLGGSYTKEIAILTLAEGFKWIKHSLYGA